MKPTRTIISIDFFDFYLCATFVSVVIWGPMYLDIVACSTCLGLISQASNSTRHILSTIIRPIDPLTCLLCVPGGGKNAVSDP